LIIIKNKLLKEQIAQEQIEQIIDFLKFEITNFKMFKMFWINNVVLKFLDFSFSSSENKTFKFSALCL